jgi:hypothetical protein
MMNGEHAEPRGAEAEPARVTPQAGLSASTSKLSKGGVHRDLGGGWAGNLIKPPKLVGQSYGSTRRMLYAGGAATARSAPRCATGRAAEGSIG